MEFDNYGRSRRPGEPGQGRFWIWGWDEITWFSQQPENARNDWLRYAWKWVREHDPDGYLQMPGMRVISGAADSKRWYYVNQPSAATPNGYGQEQTIRAIWSGYMKDNNALSSLVKRFSIMFAMLVLAQSVVQAQRVLPATTSALKFRVLALAESGGHHVEFTKAAKPWLTKCGAEDGFEVDYITNTVSITETFLARYRLVLQLDFVPYGWTPEAMAAFKAYIEEGRGGWVGLHHATLLGDFDGYPMWPWFSDFMGSIKFKNYIPKFSSGTVHVEDKAHPCMKDVPESFIISREEWYTYDRSPRANVHVLASVDESTYSDPSAVRMGDHPVIWTNERMVARNVYIFMGHGPWLFEDKAFTTLFRNAILWAAEKQPSAKSK